MLRRVLAPLLAFALVLVGLTAVQVASPPQAEAAYATGGGKYVNQIFWLDWSTAKNSAGGSLTPLADGTYSMQNNYYVENSPVPGYTIRATVTNIAASNLPGSADPTVNDPLRARVQDANYSDVQAKTGSGASAVVNGYSTGTQRSRLVPRRDGLTVSFDLVFSVYRDGVLIPGEYPAVIAADGENLNANENIAFTTTGEAWKNIENVGYPAVRSMWALRTGAPTTPWGSVTNGGFGTQTFGRLTSAGAAVPLGVSRNAQKVTVNISSSGREDVLLGFFPSTDHGDAPASFGDAAHLLKWDTAGQPRPTDATPANQPRIVFDPTTPYLGANPPDSEGAASTPSWTGDDNAGDYNGVAQKDESWADLKDVGQQDPVQCAVPQYSLTIKTKNADGKTVAGWIDWNGNGVFDTGERASATAVGDKATLVWNNPATPTGTTVGSRFRVSSTPGDLNLPTGLAGDGEVEDHLIPVQKCGLTLTKTANPTKLDANNKTVTYTFVVTNSGAVPLNNVTINDSMLVGSPFTLPAPSTATLAAGASATLTKSYTIDQDRVEQGGVIRNEATAAGTYAGNSSGTADDAEVISAKATADITVDNTSSLTITKALDQNTAPKVGDVLTYTIVVTNNGQTRLNGVKVDDPLLAGGKAHLRDNPSQFTTSLAPGAQAVFAGSYTVTQADLDGQGNIKNGVLKNTATVSGTTAGGTAAGGSASASTPFTPSPAVKLEKTGPGTVSGNTITYDFKLTNTGDVSLTNATFTDAKLGITDEQVFPTGGQTKLVPGEWVTFQKTYTIMPADRAAAQVVNTASAKGTPITGGPQVNSPPSTVTTKVTSTTSLTLAKAGTVDHGAHTGPAGSVDAAGDTINYTFTVKNTGQLTVKDFTYTDALLGKSNAATTVKIVGGPRDGQTVSDLLPGETGTFTGSYTATQDDVDAAADIKNIASITGTPVTADTSVAKPTADSNTVSTPVLGSKTFTVKKALAAGESATAKRKVGDVINYVVTITNTGSASLNGLTYSDPLTGATDVPVPNQPLAPGATRDIAVSYTVKQADVDAGKVDNVATAKLAAGTPVTSNTVTVPTVNDAALSLSKQGTLSATGPGGAARAGDTITYALTVKNTGSVTITDPVVTDAKLGLNKVTCVPSGADPAAPHQQLAPGASCVVAGSYVLTQADVDARTVHNDASVAGTDPQGGAVTAKGSTDVDAIGATGLTLDKKGTPLDAAKAGDKVSYTFTVKNTGTVTITNAVVSDPKLGGTFTVSPSTLKPGETGTVTATGAYTLTQEDVDKGSVSNTATVTGSVPDGYTKPSATDSEKTLTPGTAVLQADKTADKTEITRAGEVITYTLTMSNQGSVTMDSVSFWDPMLKTADNPTGLVPGSGFSLAPGASKSLTFTHVVTQDEVDAKVVKNQADYRVDYTQSGSESSLSGKTTEVQIPVKGAPALAIVKERTDTTTPSKAGDKVTFKVTVTNTGNTTLTNVKASDAPAGVADVGLDKTTLLPDEKATGTVDYTVTQADIDAGTFTNNAKASASSKSGEAVPDATSNDVVVPFAAAPGWTVSKVSNKETLAKVGDTVSYQLTVKNTGNVTLKNIELTDANAQIEANEAFELAPGAERTFTAKHVVTQADIDAGKVDNVARATAEPVRGTNPGEQSSATVTDPVAGTVGFSVEKKATNQAAPTKAGDKVTFDILVKNEGTTTLREVYVTDPLTGQTLKQIAAPEGLAPGATATLSVEYTLTQVDVDAGSVSNTATASVVPPAAYEAPPAKDASATQKIEGKPAFTLEKVSEPTPDPLTGAGDKVKYTLTLKNTGTTTLTNPRITDAKLGLEDATPEREGTGGSMEPVSSLAPGESATLTGTWTVTQAEVDAGLVENSAVARVDVPDAYEAQNPGEASAHVEDVITRSPTLSIKKDAAVVEAATATQAGQHIRYTLTVKNEGNTTLYRATVSDPLAGPDPLPLSPTTLAPGDEAVASFDHVITQEEADAGIVKNTASATAVPPAMDGSEPPADATPLPEQSASKDVPVDAKPGVDITKTADAEPGKDLSNAKAGDKIIYTITVHNTGQTTLHSLAVTDALVGLDAEDVGTLAPDAKTVLTREYVLKQSDIDAGTRANTASVSGLDPKNKPTSDETTLKTPVTGPSSFTIEKTFTVLTASGLLEKEGDEVRYTLTLRNTGATTLTDLQISDPMGGGALAVTPDSIAPGKSATASFVHAVTQDELDVGEVVNQATAKATPPYGPELPEQPSNKVELPTDGKGALSVVKGLRGTASKISHTVVYPIDEQTTSALTHTLHTQNDPKVSKTPVAVTPSTLKPGAHGTAEVVYTLTQADVDAGGFDNKATASGEDPDGEPVKSPDSNVVTLDVVRSPSLSVDKKALLQPGQVLTKAGDKLEYELSVTNTGNVTLEGATVTDKKLGQENVAVSPSTLKPGETGKVVFSYTLTQDDVDAQRVINVATGAAHPSYDPDKTVEPAEPVTVRTPIDSTASLLMTKTVTPPAEGTISAAGDEVEYTFELTNTGTRTLTGASLNDPLLGGDVELEDTVLGPNESTTVKVKYKLTQADVDRGIVNNTASATATPKGDSAALPSVKDSAKLGVNGKVAMDLEKKPISTEVPTKAGDVIRYKITAKNTGTLTLSNVVVKDPGSDEKAATIPGELAPNASAEVEFTHTVTQADVNAGSFTNTATVSGTGPTQEGQDPQTVTDHPSNTVTTPIAGRSALLVEKTQDEDVTLRQAGDKLSYTVKVTNVGTTTVYDPEITDPLAPSNPIKLGKTTLDPKESDSYTFEYTLTQADVDRGSVSNTATATATPPSGYPAITPTPSNTVTKQIDGEPGFEVEKSSTHGELTKAGDTVVYTITVRNTGTTTVFDPRFDDAKLGLENASFGVDELAPGAFAAKDVEYTLTQADVDAGSVANTAVARVVPPVNYPALPSVTSNEVIDPIAAVNAFSVSKAAKPLTEGAPSKAGDTIEYTLTVKNEGTTTLHGASVSDAKLGVKDAPVKPATLAPGQSGSASFTYTLTQDDVNSRSVVNTASGIATPPPAFEPLDPQDSETVTTPVTPVDSLLVEKGFKPLPDGATAKAGDEVTFWVKVTNNGTSTLNGVSVKDPLVGEESKPAGKGGTLEPGESDTVEFVYTLTQADVDKGLVENTATATYTPAGTDTPVERDSNPVTVGLNGSAALSTFKQRVGEGFPTQAGDVIAYDITVSNTGTKTVSDVEVSDPGSDEKSVRVEGSLKPGESATVRVHHTLTQAEVDSGAFENTASATGQPPAGPGGETPPRLDPAPSNTVTTPVLSTSAYTVVKSASSGTLTAAGQEISFSIVVTNTGTTTLHGVTVSDPMNGPEPVTAGSGTLAPGESATVEFTHQVTQAEVDAGEVVNTATGAARGPGGDDELPPVTSNTTRTPVKAGAALKVEKSAVVHGAGTAEQSVEYTVKVINTGATTLSSVTVTDPLVGAQKAAVTPDRLAPGESGSVTFTYAVTKADLARGSLTNTATASAVGPNGVALGGVASNKVVTKLKAPPVVPPVVPPVDPPVDPPVTIPETGARVLGLLGLALVLLLGGAALVMRRRRAGA